MSMFDFFLRKGTGPVILSSIALILTFCFTFDCAFFCFQSDDGFYYGYGFFKKGLSKPDHDYVTCSPYAIGQWELIADGSFKFGRGMATLAVLLAFPAFFAVIYPWCIPVACKRCTKFVACLCMSQTVHCFLSLSAMGSDQCQDNSRFADPCVIGRGGTTCVFAALFWLATTIWLCRMPEVTPEEVAAYNTREGRGLMDGDPENAGGSSTRGDTTKIASSVEFAIASKGVST